MRQGRRDDGPLVTRLLLTTGDIAENDLADPARALAFFRRADEIGDLPAEAATALARIGATCDPAARDRALDRLARLSREAASPEEQADALYRLSEAQLAAACAEGGPMALAKTKEFLRQFSRQSLSIEDAATASAAQPTSMATPPIGVIAPSHFSPVRART